MLTLVIPNRNRDLTTVARTLGSIAPQLDEQLRLVVIDYGSKKAYQQQLVQLCQQWPKIEVMLCMTQGQLWQKTRAINIVLKRCQTPFFMVADMDMLFHPEFKQKIMPHCQEGQATYFQVGILSETESQTPKAFEQYDIKFITDHLATGMTLAPTTLLQAIGGYDEFYHGWGSEDTDLHVRLRNTTIGVHFYQEQTLLLHQWHPKAYRSKQSTAPFHTYLERINQQYLLFTTQQDRTKANTRLGWGQLPEARSYERLAHPESEIHCYNMQEQLSALWFQLREGLTQGVVHIRIERHPEMDTTKTKIKKALNKKTPLFIAMDEANNQFLECIISHLRNAPYQYRYDRSRQAIYCEILLDPSL